MRGRHGQNLVHVLELVEGEFLIRQELVPTQSNGIFVYCFDKLFLRLKSNAYVYIMFSNIFTCQDYKMTTLRRRQIVDFSLILFQAIKWWQVLSWGDKKIQILSDSGSVHLLMCLS